MYSSLSSTGSSLDSGINLNMEFRNMLESVVSSLNTVCNLVDQKNGPYFIFYATLFPVKYTVTQ